MSRILSKGRSCLAAVFALCLALPVLSARAEEFTAPKGEVLLTTTGSITAKNVDGALKLDIDQLAALPQHEFTTATTWTEGTPTFKGVLLKDFIAAIGATGSVIHLTALNDYRVSLPMSDVQDDGPMLAYLMNGQPMSLRDKGPVWLVYPYDQNAKYRTEQTYSRSIWQLDRIEFQQ